MSKYLFKRYKITKNELFFFIAVVLLIFIIVPLLLTNNVFYFKDFSKTGDIGDTIGGITAPFLALLGSILVYIAFKEQIRANQLIQKQFRIQQFQSQFYEMLRLHKENVTEMEVQIRNINKSNELIRGRDVFRIFRDEIHILIEKSLEINGTKLNDYGFSTIYQIYFWGTENIGNQTLSNEKPSENILQTKLTHAINSININNSSGVNYYENKPNYYKLNFGEGHSSSLGHYYRHLYYMVKFIHETHVIKEKAKLQYLKTLRAQLSNYEQIMLFYNWVAGFGKNWENGIHEFFTRYKMIHNLWDTEIHSNEFFHNKIKELIELHKNQNRGDDDILFEFLEVRKIVLINT